MMKNLVIVLILLCILGCRTKLSSKSLNREYEAEKIDKVLFSDLPIEVKDTISKIYEAVVSENPTPCDYSTVKRYPRDILLDTNYSMKDYRHVNRKYWDHDAKFLERNGTTFSIGSKKFFIPIENPSVFKMILFQGQLYVMGESTKKHPQIFDCKDPNYLRVYYEDYYFWVINLEK